MEIKEDKILLTKEEAEYLKTGDYKLIDPLRLHENRIKIVDGKIILPKSEIDNRIKITDDGIVFIKKGVN